MKVEYTRTAKKSYMIVRGADYPFAQYELMMIRHNDLACLLPFQMILADGAAEYWYDVSGMRSLATSCSVESLGAKQLRVLLEHIMELKSAMEEYLLDDANISFAADMVYYDQARDRIRFCYIPGLGGAKAEDGSGPAGVSPGNADGPGQGAAGIRELFEELLQHINHADPAAVRMGYEMYERSARAPFAMADCVDCLRIGEDTPAKGEEAFTREQSAPWQSVTSDSPDIRTDVENEDVEFLDDWPQRGEGHRKKRRHETKPQREKSVGMVREKRREFGLDKDVGKHRRKLREEEEDKEELLFALRSNSRERSADSGKTEVLLPEESVQEWKLLYKGNGVERDLAPENFPFLVGSDTRRVNGTLLARTVSRVHAKLYLEEDRLYVEDFNSTNGTYLNQQLLPMNTPAELKAGDRIVFATEEYEVFHRSAYGPVQ